MLPSPAGREASPGIGAPPYVRHRPERTLLYQLVEEYYPAFKAHLAGRGADLPGYVQQEFEDYLNLCTDGAEGLSGLLRAFA